MSDVAIPANSLIQVAAVKLGGSALSNEVMADLLEVRVSLAVGVASRAEVRFSDGDFKLIDDAKFTVGQAMEIAFTGHSGALTTVFKGEVVAVGIEQARSQRHELVLEAFDKTHRLGKKTHVRTFLNMTYASMVSKIANDAGLTADTAGASFSETFKYMIQRGSDIAFLDQIALRTGTEWFVDDTKLVVRKRPSDGAVAKLKFGVDLVKFRARYSGSEHVTGVKAQGWDPTTKQPIVGQDTTAYKSPPNSSRSGGSDSYRAKAAGFGDRNVFTGNLVVDAASEANTVAAALGARQATNELIARGEVIGDPTLKAGVKIEVQNVGTNLSGTYYLTEVQHVFGRGGDLVTRFTAGGLDSSAIVDLLGPAESIGPWGQDGLMVGLVTNNKDPDGLGRVKVKFPTLSDEVESNWARVVGIGAANGRGFQVLPEVNDEVLIGFEHGDLRRPFVIGGLWNNTDKQQVAQDNVVKDGKVQKWSLKSRLGNDLIIDDSDTADNNGFHLLNKDTKTKLLLLTSKIQLINDAKDIEINNGKGSIVIKANGDIIIKGTKITVDGQDAVTVKSATNLEATANSGIKIESKATLDVKGSGPVTVESSAVTSVKGATSVKIN